MTILCFHSIPQSRENQTSNKKTKNKQNLIKISWVRWNSQRNVLTYYETSYLIGMFLLNFCINILKFPKLTLTSGFAYENWNQICSQFLSANQINCLLTNRFIEGEFMTKKDCESNEIYNYKVNALLKHLFCERFFLGTF